MSTAQATHSVTLERRTDIDLESYRRVAREGAGIVIGDAAAERMSAARDAFLALVESDPSAFIYGVTTSAGDGAATLLDADQRRNLARMLGRSGASFGESLPERVVRGMVLTRLTGMIEGNSGARPELARAVTGMLDGPLPTVPSQGNGGSGYSGFRLHPGGSLTPVAGSTVTVPDGSGLGDVFFNTHGNHLIGTRTGTSLIDSFVVRPDGRLLAAHGSPFTGQGLGQLGAEFSPARPSQLFVSNAHNGTGLGTISAYRDAFSGHLTSVGSSPFADGQTAPCWVEISHDGTYLFTVNTGSGNISSYAIKRNGSLVLIGSFAIKGGGANIDARLSPYGKYLLVNGSGPHFVSVFAVNGGNLTEVPSSPTPLPAGATSSSGIVNT